MPVTTTREEWSALAAHVEGVTGPDRELDALIWLHLPEQEEMARNIGRPAWQARQIAGSSYIPSYTSSVDDAMTLRPEGAAFFVEHQPWRLGPTAHAQITLTEGTADGWVFAVGESACGPALALLAACCRAQADLAVQS